MDLKVNKVHVFQVFALKPEMHFEPGKRNR